LKGNTLKIRNIAVLGSFAAGAALALAPLASAVPTDPLISVVDSEIATENSLFQTYAALVGDSNDITVATTPGTFDTFATPADLLKDAPHLTNVADASQVTPLEYELYGLNPIAAGISSATGPFNEFNGALTEFYDAYNTELFALANPTAAIDTIPLTDLFGSSTGIAEALATGSATSAVTDFLTDGFADLQGFFAL
jgi:hypothetical protein